MSRQALEEAHKCMSQKRKRSSTGGKPPSKKLKLDKPSKKRDSKGTIKGQSKLNFKPTTPKVNGTPKTQDTSSDSDSPLVNLKKTPKKSKKDSDSDSDDSDTPLAVIASSPRKSLSSSKKKETTVDSDDSDVVLSKIAKSPQKKRGRGRPPGSPNKSARERAAIKAAKEAKIKAAENGERRGPGRPPGSVNKKGEVIRQYPLSNIMDS